MKPKALVWFTGVISKYNIAEYNIEELDINHNLLNKIYNNYDPMFIIYVKDDNELKAYTKLLHRLDIKEPVCFVGYQDIFTDVLDKLKQAMGSFILIDYSKKRLIEAANILERNDMIHISQLID